MLLWLIVIATLAAAIIALVVVLVVVNTGDSGDHSAADGDRTSAPLNPGSTSTSPQSTGPSSSPRSSSSTTTTTTTRPSSSSRTTTTTTRPVRLPRGVDLCAEGEGGIEMPNVGALSDTTSCPFAEEVRIAYLQQLDRDGEVTVEAVSPVTGDSYTMSCRGSAPVVCTGGNDARVYLY